MKRADLYQIINAALWLQKGTRASQQNEIDEEERDARIDSKQNKGKQNKNKPRLAW